MCSAWLLDGNTSTCFMLLVPEKIKGNNVTVFENDKVAVVQIERSGPLDSEILIHVATVDGTAIGKMCDIQICNYCAGMCFDLQLM